MKKLLGVLFLLCVGLVVAAGLVERWSSAAPHWPRREEFKPVSPQRGRIMDAVNATGVLQPVQVAVVGTDLSGKVVEICPQADFNQKVKKGDPLLRLDDRLARQKLEQAKRAVELAEADISRAEALREVAEKAYEKAQLVLKQQVGFQRDLDRADAERKAAAAAVKAAQARKGEAEAALRLAQLGIEVLTLGAPIDGVIIDRKVAVGQSVSPLMPTPLFTIASDLARMEVHAQVTEGDVGKVRIGQQATFLINDYSDKDSPSEGKPVRFEGKVTQIRPMPASLQGAVFFTVVVAVDNKKDDDTGDWYLRPGMPVSVDLIRREHKDTWLIPTEALELKPDEHYLSPEARRKLQEWEQKPTEPLRAWKCVWMLDADDRLWPVFVRTGGGNAQGEPALRGSAIGGDGTTTGGEYQEVLEWDADLKGKDNPGALELITDVPQLQKRSLFDVPKIPRLF